MREKNNNIPVIMYHSIGPNNPDWLWNLLTTPVNIFEKQINLLSKKGFTTITLKELHDYMKYNKNTPNNSIVLTFDDGYLDNWVYAYPILKKYGMKGTIFVNPEFVDPIAGYRPNQEDVWKGRFTIQDVVDRGFLSWQEMLEMEKSGVMDIQSHSMSHTWYFCSDKIVDFHHPGNCRYPWLFWNARPERKSYYLLENQESFVPYGSPIYEFGRSLGVRRYFEDKGLSDYLTDFVRKKGEGFFKDEKWRSKMLEQVNGYKNKNEIKGRLETDEDMDVRYRYELIESKKILESKLGKKIEFLCWAGGSFNDKALNIAREAGYVSSTLFYNNPQRKNSFGENPSEINRTGCVSAFCWHDKFISYPDAGLMLANIRYFQGNTFYIWIVRLYKLKYLLKYLFWKLFKRGVNT